ncbi:hypothetical protein CP061683_0556B, partial [Chlamydia psittaci 06-1683]
LGNHERSKRTHSCT